MFDLEDIVEQLDDEGISGVTSDIVDYDWDIDDVRQENSARVTIWLKREESDD